MERKSIIHQWQWCCGYKLQVYVKTSRSASWEYRGFVKFFKYLSDAEAFAAKYTDEIEYTGEVF